MRTPVPRLGISCPVMVNASSGRSSGPGIAFGWRNGRRRPVSSSVSLTTTLTVRATAVNALDAMTGAVPEDPVLLKWISPQTTAPVGLCNVD